METTRGDLVKEYEKTAYSLLENEIGGPIKTKYGYHLIKLLNKKGEKNKVTTYIAIFISFKKRFFKRYIFYRLN